MMKLGKGNKIGKVRRGKGMKINLQGIGSVSFLIIVRGLQIEIVWGRNKRNRFWVLRRRKKRIKSGAYLRVTI